MPGYTLISRHERHEVKSGGAAMFLRDGLTHTLHPSICTNGTHILLADVFKSGALFRVGGTYIAPASSTVADPLDAIVHKVNQALSKVHVLAGGDYNLSFGYNEWQGDADDRGQGFFDMLDSCACIPLEFRGYSRVTEHYRSTPDHVIVHESRADDVTVRLAEPGSSDHVPLYIECRSEGYEQHKKTRSRWRLKKADWHKYSELLDAALAEVDPMTLAPLVAWNHFENAMLKSARASIPYGKQRKGAKAWWNDELTAQQAKLTALHATLNDPHLDTDRATKVGGEYSALRQKFKHAVSSARTSVWRSLCTGANTLDQVYSLLRNMKGAPKRAAPVGLVTGATTVYDDDARSHLLLQYFRNKSTPTVDEKRADRRGITHLRQSMSAVRKLEVVPASAFSLAAVDIAIQSGASNKSPGADNVPMEFYQHSGLRARVWISLVMNGLMRHQVLPSAWKRVVWKPVLKPSKTGTDVSHYRPISLMCAGFKIYERLMEMQLNARLPPLHTS
eukprot:667601-Amphidinium_carterae.1